MSKYYCNPLNLPYKYNFQMPNMPGLGEAKLSVYREAADPTLELFKGRYYLFPSMTRGFYVSDNMVDWDTGRVYSLFDGKWPVFGEQPVPLYDQVVSDTSRRSLIPAKVNGEATTSVPPT